MIRHRPEDDPTPPPAIKAAAWRAPAPRTHAAAGTPTRSVLLRFAAGGALALGMLAISPPSEAARWAATWSEVTGERYHSAVPDRAATRIRSIDGRRYMSQPVRLDPGAHVISLQSLKRKGLRGAEQTLTLMLEPCRRYFLNAALVRPRSDDWKPVIDETQVIAECRTQAAPLIP